MSMEEEEEPRRAMDVRQDEREMLREESMERSYGGGMNYLVGGMLRGAPAPQFTNYAMMP